MRPLNWEERLAGALREAQADLVELAIESDVNAGHVGTPRYWEREALYLEWLKQQGPPPPHYGWRALPVPHLPSPLGAGLESGMRGLRSQEAAGSAAMNPELRDRLIDLLVKLAYPADDMDICPFCSSWVDEFGHEPDCELAACLKELRGDRRTA